MTAIRGVLDPVPVPVLASLTAAAGKELLKKPLGDVYEYVKGKAKRQILRWNTNRNVSQAYAKLISVRRVKTLWQIDKAVDLTTFYCPSYVQIDKHRTRIDSVDDLDIPENILIEGIAGRVNLFY
jgi:hypothetical protein